MSWPSSALPPFSCSGGLTLTSCAKSAYIAALYDHVRVLRSERDRLLDEDEHLHGSQANMAFLALFQNAH